MLVDLTLWSAVVVAVIAVIVCGVALFPYTNGNVMDYCLSGNPYGGESSGTTYRVTLLPYGVGCRYVDDSGSNEVTQTFRDIGTPAVVTGLAASGIAVAALTARIVRRRLASAEATETGH